MLKRLILRLFPEGLLQATKRIYYARVLRSISEDDEKDVKVVKHLVAPGSSVADVGANVGVYTKFLSALAGSRGRVYSVEPFPLTFDILSSNVRKLSLQNVELINAAISDRDGTVTMEVPRYQSGGENFYEARIVSGEADPSLRRAEVEARSLDSLFCHALAEITFIKCDVEGNELNAIKGAAGLIDASRPAWLLEIMGDPDDPKSDARKTFDELSRKGYEAFWFDGADVRKRAKGERNDNYFFLTPSHIQALRTAGFPVRTNP